MSEMGVRVPQRLDDSERILIFSMDEFIGFIITFGTGLALGNALLALGASLGVLFGLRQLKAGAGLGGGLRWMFWNGLGDYFRISASPPPYIRHWVL